MSRSKSRVDVNADPARLTWKRGKMMGCPPPRFALNDQSVVVVVWSIKFRPTGRSTRCVTPAAASTSRGPMPDCCRITGVLMLPAAMMTSRPALAV